MSVSHLVKDLLTVDSGVGSAMELSRILHYF